MKKIVVIFLTIFCWNIYAQSPIDEGAIPTTGISYQNGPGGGNAQNWKYTYGAKLSVFGSTYRNFEIMNTHKTGNSTLAMRTYDPEISGWTDWREFIFKSQSGFVGIGINNPSFPLDVYKETGTEIVAQFRTREGAINIAAAGNSTGNSTYGNFISSRNSNNTAYEDLGLKTASGAPQLLVKTNGSVAIGTSSTGSHKLAVEGSIGAREIKVEAFPNWSDFVFDKDYELPTLIQVEEHIKEKGHLKDIPSAEEVKEDGINLGEMNAKLLQKIEELTLYLIEQNKELKFQNEQNQAQQVKIELLEKKISQLENK